MKSFTIPPADDGVRLNRYLEKVAPGLPGSLMYSYLRKKRIKLNNKRCEASTRLRSGDTLSLFINDEFFTLKRTVPEYMKASRELDILFEDDNIAVLYKPAGLLSHGTATEYGDTLINRFLRYLVENGSFTPADEKAFTPAICNRLDRGTEGLVLAAKNADALRGINEMIRGNRIKKVYLCAASGKAQAAGVYNAWLTKDEKRNTVTIRDKETPGSKKITTAFHIMKKNDELMLLEVTLFTGRSHQIRAHLAYLGCPVLGDAKYGNAEFNRKYHVRRQTLCAYKMIFDLDPELDKHLYYLHRLVVKLDTVWFEEKYFT